MASLPASATIMPCFCSGGREPPANSLNLAGGIHFSRIGLKEKFLYGTRGCLVVPSPLAGHKSSVSALPRALLQRTEQSSISSSTADWIDKVCSYLFSTEFGNRVKVSVQRERDKYNVVIEVANTELPHEGNLTLTWGMFRSESSSFLEFDSGKPTPGFRTTDTPFVQISSGIHSVGLEFESKKTPVYLSFYLSLILKTGAKASPIKSNRLNNFCVPIGFGSGRPAPLGLSFSNDGFMNFAIVSRNTNGVVLCLYDNTSVDKPVLELDLDPVVNKTGDVWHASIENTWNFNSYGYRFRTRRGNLEEQSKEEVIKLDPYAKAIMTSISSRGYIGKESPFDWTGDLRPNIPMEKLIVYRMNVARFSQDKSSQLSPDVAGTFTGVAEKVNHLKNLGVNAVLLEPVFSFDEKQGPYFPHNFFTPSKLYGPSDDPMSSIIAMKEMVKAFHASGMEVLLEVVLTHASDVDSIEDLHSENRSNCNFPVIQRLILDSLHHWVTEFHIDGFCFMNASCLLVGHDGKHLPRPPIVEAISFDPLLSTAKIIADFWDPQSMTQKNPIFPHWKRWAEVNSAFCYDIRNFLRGKGALSHLATRLCGSGDIFFSGRGPAYSFNYFSRNFGLPLLDLVSFSDTEVVESEMSWNCGEEGPTKKTAVLETRLKQIRNYFFILFVSLGVPVLNMGDECGQSSGGSTCYHDRGPLDWSMPSSGFGTQIMQFISFLSSLRTRRNDHFQRTKFLDEDNIFWYGTDLSPPKWDDPASKFLSVLLKPDEPDSEPESGNSIKQRNIFMAFNVSDQTENVTLPSVPEGFAWHRLVDTALPYPGFFSNVGEPLVDSAAYEVKPCSCILFESIRE